MLQRWSLQELDQLLFVVWLHVASPPVNMQRLTRTTEWHLTLTRLWLIVTFLCAQAAAAELGWNRRLNMALEAAKGMLYLHSRAEAVLHRDLKSANLLVDKHWRVKVADFNLSRVMNASAVVSSVSATNPRRALTPS